MKLYAKSGQDAATVLSHCQDVRAVADAITKRIGSDLRNLIPGLPDSMPQLLAVAALLHDLLKANSSFQGMLHSKTYRQPVRHEVLAAVMLTSDGPLSKWLTAVLPDDTDRWAVVWAVAAHHFKMIDPARKPSAPLFRDGGVAKHVTLHLDHPDVQQLLADATAVLQLKVAVPTLAAQKFAIGDDDPASLRELVRRYPVLASLAWKKLKADPATQTKVAVLKALLAASDAGGSALPQHGHSCEKWTHTALSVRLSADDLDQVVAKDKAKGFRKFQETVASSRRPVTIVAAGCGNGKTTAAYLWAQKWAIGKKLFFTYPTTGTSTAGYQGYLADQHNLPTDLIHSRSGIDLADMQMTPTDADENHEQKADEEARIDSLRTWDRKIVVCTVDTVLGLLQNQRRGVYSFPAFAAGAFVFDELHSYDARLFGGLLRFLKIFPGVPALLMSASIPPARLKALKDVLGDRAGDVVRGDPVIEGYKRYRLEHRESTNDCRERVVKALKDEQKVLWVCNTVKDAIAIGRSAKEWTDVIPIIYHSRFKYDDRRKRQEDVIKQFRGNGPAFVITTQVCEMSLDISADLLVTAECPLPALVQRLGRLNRYATSDDPWPCLVYPFEGLPYNEKPESIDLHGDQREGMTATRETVRELNGEACNQAMLADRLEEMKTDAEPQKYSAWLDDGWVTEPMPVRDGDQTMNVILHEDRHQPRNELPRFTIPMPVRRGVKFEEYTGSYPVATEQINYSPVEGAEWK